MWFKLTLQRDEIEWYPTPLDEYPSCAGILHLTALLVPWTTSMCVLEVLASHLSHLFFLQPFLLKLPILLDRASRNAGYLAQIPGMRDQIFIYAYVIQSDISIPNLIWFFCNNHIDNSRERTSFIEFINHIFRHECSS